MKARTVHHLQSHPPTDEELLAWVGWRATDELGRALGRVEDAYRVGEQLRWLLIRSRRTHHLLVPVRDAVGSEGSVFLPYTHEQLVSAPEVKSGTVLADRTLKAAAEHYDLEEKTQRPDP